MGNINGLKATAQLSKNKPTQNKEHTGKFILSDVRKEELEKRRVPVYPYLI